MDAWATVRSLPFAQSREAAVKVLVLTRYGRLGASTRMRFLQFLPYLKEREIDCVVDPLLDDGMLRQRYGSGQYSIGKLAAAYAHRLRTMRARHAFDLVWIEKECLPWLPATIERWLLSGVPYVLDYDDAIFHNYDAHPKEIVRALLGRRLDVLMADARLVVAGNSYLAERAKSAGARWVEIVPTVVDITRYHTNVAPRSLGRELTVVWIGSPSTSAYLDALIEPLAALQEYHPTNLRIIGGGNIAIPGVHVEAVDWSEPTEAQSIVAGDVGVMPLRDTAWERGKCGYKLIQYMACGLPVIASPVGINNDIVEEGVNGYLANTSADWLGALKMLANDSALRARLGSAGRKKVEAQYCTQIVGPRLAELLIRAATA
jgi:glycosyltransferase involved in cell wall biosynthesis